MATFYKDLSAFTPLYGERITITRPSYDHLQGMLEARAASHKELDLWMGWSNGIPTEQELRTSIGDAITLWENHISYRMPIIRNSDQKFLGSTGYIRYDTSVPKVEIGYWIRTDECGKGYATEALELLTDYSFYIGCCRVEVRCDEDNLASAKVAEKLKFQYEGTHRCDGRKNNGELRNTRVYAIT